MTLAAEIALRKKSEAVHPVYRVPHPPGLSLSEADTWWAAMRLMLDVELDRARADAFEDGRRSKATEVRAALEQLV